MSTVDEGNPQVLLDWLIVQHTCEWCGGNIDWYDPDGRATVPKAMWRCREVKHGGWTSKHWKHWRVCSQCHHDFGNFSRWIFPVIKSVMPEHMSLDAIMQVQPMGQPAGEIMYMDYIRRVAPPAEGRVRGKMLPGQRRN